MKPRNPPDISKLVQLFGAGRFAEMEKAARALVKTYPRHGVLWKALGVALSKQQKNALDAMQRAAEFSPNDAEVHYNLGVESQLRQQFDLAEASYCRTLALQPQNVHALNNLGNILKDRGCIEDAEASYRQAIALDPSYAEAYYNLGLTLQDCGRLAEAEQNYRLAISNRPDYILAHNNLGLLLAKSGRESEAISSYQAALGINPAFLDTLVNLAGLLRQRGSYVEALIVSRRAVDNAPASAPALVALATILNELGDTDQAIGYYRQALALDANLLEAHDNLLFAENYFSLDRPLDAKAHKSNAEAYGSVVSRRARPYTDWAVSKNPARALNIGFVSGDLWSHPVGYFVDNVLGALAQHHNAALRLFIYSNTARTDELTQRIKQHCAAWLDVTHLTDAQMAERIHADDIDILIDLSGHTAQNRLPVFAWKPAPVQASWLGYFATTGVKEIDYLIADPWSVPEANDADFTETVWRLPETRLCFTPPDAAIEVGLLPALQRGHVTFGCFNNLGKLGPDVVALWAAILRALPNSVLFLKAKQFGQPAVDERMRSRFAAHGIAPERLRIEGRSTRAQYLAAYNEVDIVLDPFPFTGGTTTVEALWMGAPVLTLQGTRMIARQGVSLLRNAGLGDWVAESPEAYLRQAVARASDLPALARLRAGLRAQVLASPVFDAPRFAHHFAAALSGMWRRWYATGQAVHSD